MLKTEILFAPPSFVPSTAQTQVLFSFLQTINNYTSFSSLFEVLLQHLETILEIEYSLITDSQKIIYSKNYSEDFALNQEKIKQLEREVKNKENKIQKIVFVTAPNREEYFIYIPISKANPEVYLFMCISDLTYQSITKETVAFLENLCPLVSSAFIQIEKQEKEIKFKTIFDSFQDIYFQTDEKGIITTITPSVKTILEYKVEEVIKKPLYLFVLSKEKLENLFFILKEREKIKNYELVIHSKTGVAKTMLCNFQIIKNKNYVLGIEGIAREINPIKKANQEAEKSKQNIERLLESKKQFLADMGHEIRTPMNGIIGMIDLLKTTKLAEEQLSYIQSIEESSNELLIILNNVLDLSKIEANKMLLKPEVFELKTLLGQLPLLFEKELNKKSLHLSIYVTDRTPNKIIADKSRLLQVFGNLLSNAIKYNLQNGKITISVDILTEENGKLLLQGKVKDTGIGISEENQEFLFDSFSKLQHNYQKTVSGTGLGLAIAKQLITIMGGVLQVWSKEKEGSTFYFSFEALKSTEINLENASNEFNLISPFSIPLAENQTDKNKGNWQNSFINSPLILVVDDNSTNLNVAKKILQKAGCQIITAVNGKEAIQKIKDNYFQLVFMDIQMPEMDGVTATRFIKRLHKIHVPPIIALTAFAVAEEKDRFIAAGMDDYLSKPVKAELLIQKAKQWIDSKFYNLEENRNESTTSTIEDKAENTISKTTETTKLNSSKTPSLHYLPIVNTQTAQQLQKWGGQELVDESYQLFEEETAGLLQEAIMAHAQNDRTTLKLHVHTIKGSAATLGVDRMAIIATEMDILLKENIDAKVEEQLQAFQHSFEEYKLNYRIILNL